VEREQHILSTSTPQLNISTQPSMSISTQEPIRTAREGPNHDFYNDCYGFPPIIYAFFVAVMILGLKYTVTGYSPTEVSQFLFFPYFFLVVLVAPVVCRHAPASRAGRRTVWTCCFVSYSLMLGYTIFSPARLISLIVLSCTCLAIVIFAEWKLWRKNKAMD
jgi:hypothetical protein